MIIIGFDPGINKTGFGVIDASSNNPQYVVSGIIEKQKLTKTNSGGDNNHKHLAHIREQVEKLLNDYKPQYCAVEQVFGGPYIQSHITLAMARGVILSAIGSGIGGGIDNSDIGLASYSTTSVKKTIAGNGKATKEEVNIMMKRHLKLTGIISEDASDALAVCLCLFYNLKR
ncbi:MAG: crossover junction endodeoxyribonuclease RuvC [Candidatus Portiera sp.]|nr:crossover junction endodeoxyribonuclease RuvC [Portiera sp.]